MEESPKRRMHLQKPTIDGDGVGESAFTRYNTNRPPSFLRRRNSIATSVVVPTKSTDPAGKNLHAYSFPNGGSPPASLEFDLNSYTSLKDILPVPPAATAPAALDVCSSTANSRSSIFKQAAWAYLQKTSSSPRLSGDGFLHRIWLRFSAPVNACLGFISRAVDRILRTVLVGSSR